MPLPNRGVLPTGELYSRLAAISHKAFSIELRRYIEIKEQLQACHTRVKEEKKDRLMAAVREIARGG